MKYTLLVNNAKANADFKIDSKIFFLNILTIFWKREGWSILPKMFIMAGESRKCMAVVQKFQIEDKQL